MLNRILFASLTMLALITQAPLVEAKPIQILFLGDNGHHQPAARFRQLAPVLKARGITLTYTDQASDLNTETLANYDGLVIYANTPEISLEQEAALLSFVSEGGGFIPLHCASYCFLNSPKFIELVGAQFNSHEVGVFRTELEEQDHQIAAGFGGFESWDETYTHHRHAADRTILEYRSDDNEREPWTWVRNHGEGRVFYTAWGHDERTWGNTGFHSLVERGIRWAVRDESRDAPAFDDSPEMTKLTGKASDFRYVDANIPFYPAADHSESDGDSAGKMQLPMSPEVSQKHMSTPVDFQLELFASEPDIGKPICMAWDEKGRLWVCETVDYPNEKKPVGEGRDRIRICEDTNGDGKADKFTIFAEDLSIPTSLAFGYGGVIVHQAPDTLFLRDTDGDDKADQRSTLFTGWSTGDTHAGPSNLRYGIDNWYYGMVGYAGFDGDIAGQQQSFRTGFYRFRLEGDAQDLTRLPEVTEFEFLRNVNNNAWGVGFNEEGELFGSTANGNPSVHMPISNRYYERVRGWSSTVLGGIAIDPNFDPITNKVRQVDFHGEFTAGAGHALYTARSYPSIYWNRTSFVSGPTGHLTAAFLIQENGASYISRNAWNMLASDDEWSAPIVAEVGPDGQVWIIDWYNYIVQHNPTPVGFETGKGNAYETDLRDKRHGRIYRLVYDKADGKKARQSLGDSPQELTEALADTNQFWRLHAQRQLVERGQADVSAVVELISDQHVDEIGVNAGAIHGLQTLCGMNKIDDKKVWPAVVKALSHPSPGVRRNAVQALPKTDRALHALLSSGVIQDENPHVRLAAMLSLADFGFSDIDIEPEPRGEVADAILAFLQVNANLDDRWLKDAATSAAAAFDINFLLKASAADQLAETSLETITLVAEHFARSGPTKQLPELLESLKEAKPEVIVAIVSGAEAGWPKNATVESSRAADMALLQMIQTVPSANRGQVSKLASKIGSDALQEYTAEIAAELLEAVQDSEKPTRERLASAKEYIAFLPSDEAAAENLLDLIEPSAAPELSLGLLDAAGRSQAADVGSVIAHKLPTLTPVARSEAISVLLRRSEWSVALIESLESGSVQLMELSLEQKASLSAHPDKEIAKIASEMLARGGAAVNADRQKVLDELAHTTHESGSIAAGKIVFTKNCASCHTHRGEGAAIGPDLTGMAVHPKHELLTHILDPNRSVEGNFRLYSVITDEGRVFSGLLASENRSAIELFDAEGKKHVVLRDEIEDIVASTKSLMPEGFEKQMTPTEITDLLEFLTQRGKYTPISLKSLATVVSNEGMFHGKEVTHESLVFDQWGAKEFEGVPFEVADPQGGRPNVILLHGPNGRIPPSMPKSVSLPCNGPIKSLHLLGGVSGWGYPYGKKDTVSMIVRFHYADGEIEDHPLLNGVHVADYNNRVDVPESQFAFPLRSQQVRYLSISANRSEPISEIELVKGSDDSAPVIMAATIESPE